jgi:hypothetical protein
MIGVLHRNPGEMKASKCSEEHILDMTLKGKEQIDLPILPPQAHEHAAKVRQKVQQK